MKRYLLGYLSIVFLLACGDVGSSTTNQGNDDSETNVFGDTECTTTCTPVDSINCNNEDSETSTTNNQCFIVFRTCEGAVTPDGPDLTTVPPIECVQDGDDPIVLPTPFPAG